MLIAVGFYSERKQEVETFCTIQIKDARCVLCLVHIVSLAHHFQEPSSNLYHWLQFLSPQFQINARDWPLFFSNKYGVRDFWTGFGVKFAARAQTLKYYRDGMGE